MGGLKMRTKQIAISISAHVTLEMIVILYFPYTNLRVKVALIMVNDLFTIFALNLAQAIQ